MDALNQYKNDWIKHYQNIVVEYNNTVHSTIEIKPNEAKLPQNHLWVAWHLQNVAIINRKYEDIKEYQMVRIMVKQTSLIKHICQAGQVKHIKLLESVIIILCLDHPTKRKVFLRHGIRKISLYQRNNWIMYRKRTS